MLFTTEQIEQQARVDALSVTLDPLNPALAEETQSKPGEYIGFIRDPVSTELTPSVIVTMDHKEQVDPQQEQLMRDAIEADAFIPGEVLGTEPSPSIVNQPQEISVLYASDIQQPTV